jgi:integrase
MVSCGLLMGGADDACWMRNTLRWARLCAEVTPPRCGRRQSRQTRFLALTGWRTGEALGLRWAELDLARRTARLADTKTGFSLRPLSHAACETLKRLPRAAGDRVFLASRGGPNTLLHLKKFWPRVAKLADLPSDVTLHVLRHSFASLAADLGYSEPTIAALVGHKGQTVTSRYLHSADAVLLAAADAVADRTAELMGEQKPEAEVVSLRAAR